LIKINLLPVKRAKKAAPVDVALVQIGVGLLVVVVALGVCGWRWQMLTSEVAQQTTVKQNKKKELEELKKKVAEVEDYEKNKKLLEDKNRIIEQLRKNQTGPVRLLDFLSQSLDPLKVWLTTVDEATPEVTIGGKALSNDDIVEFIKNLQRMNYFTTVFLEESRQATEEGVTIYVFRLRLKIKV
jgi:type IV pilus assembly protein PilN